MKPLLLTFDVEEFDLPIEFGRRLHPQTQMRATGRGLRCILPLLARHNVRATFFITGTFAQQRPQWVRAIAADGHETAVHGLAHTDDYARMDAATAVDRLRRARTIIEETSGQPVRGVRTPRLRPCAAAILSAAGFTYDASPHPTWVPGRYNGLHLPRRPWWDAGVLRIPISVLPGLRWPVSWVWFRTAGPVAGVMAARLAAARAPYLHIYFHPWEATNIRQLGAPAWLSVGTGATFLRRLDRLLSWTRTVLTPMTVGDLAEHVRTNVAPIVLAPRRSPTLGGEIRLNTKRPG